MSYEPVFKRDNLRLYQIIDEPGTYMVKAAGRVTENQYIEDGSKSRYLVNLRAASIEQLEECLDIIGEDSTIAFKFVSQCFITGAIWEGDIQNKLDLPTKGEVLIASFDYVDGIMRCTSITLIPRRRLQTFDPDAYDKSRNLLKGLMK